jgi:RNA recognition motif-containing protein
MRGLPYTVVESDVLEFFRGYQVLGESVKLGRQTDGRSTGQAAILFQSEEACKLAMNDKQG